MPGAVAFDDLPDDLRGSAVPQDDLPIMGSGGPQNGRKYVSPAQREQRKQGDIIRGQAEGTAAAGRILGGLASSAVSEVAGKSAEIGQNVLNFFGVGGGRDPKQQQEAWREKTNFYQPPDMAKLAPIAESAPARAVGAVGEMWNAEKNRFNSSDNPMVRDILGPLYAAPYLATEAAASGFTGPVRRLMGMPDTPPIASPEVVESFARRPTLGDTPVSEAPNVYARTPAADVSRAGINVVPGEVERQVAGSGEHVTGSRRAGFGAGIVNQKNAAGNAPRINEIAIEGAPDGIRLSEAGRLEESTLQNALKVERAKYEAVRGVPGDGTSEQLVGSLEGLKGKLENLTEKADADLRNLIEKKKLGGTSAKLLEDIMDLRQQATMDAKRAFSQNDNDARAFARIKREMSDILEDELARRGEAAGLQGVSDVLRQARVNMAKIHTLEEALDQGFIDAARLEKATETGAYLTDGPQKLSGFHAAAPVSMTHPQRIPLAAEPYMRAGASPLDFIARNIQFLGGNRVTSMIGQSGVNALNKELRGFRPGPAPEPFRAPPFSFEQGPPVPNAGPQIPPELRGQRLLDSAIPDVELSPEQELQAAVAALLERNPSYSQQPLFSPNPVEPTLDDFLVDIGAQPYSPDLDLRTPQVPPNTDGALFPGDALGPPDTSFANNLSVRNFGGRNLMGDQELPTDFSQLGGEGLDFSQQLTGPTPMVAGQATPEMSTVDLWRLTQPDSGFSGDLQLMPDPPAPAPPPALLPPPSDVAIPMGRDLSPAERLDVIRQAGAKRNAAMGLTPDVRQAGSRHPGFASQLRPDQPAPPTGPQDSFAGELSLAPTDAPPRSRIDVTESGPSQGSELFPDAYKLPGAVRVETPTGYLDYIDHPDGTRQIKHTGTAKGMEGRGFAQARLLQATEQAAKDGKVLNSDVEVNKDARRVYEKLKASGDIDFDGPFDDGGPVFRNIRLKD